MLFAYWRCRNVTLPTELAGHRGHLNLRLHW